MYDKKEIGERLKDIRKKRGERREDIADALGYSEDSVKKAEQGKSISLNMLVSLSEYYGDSLDYIVYGFEGGEIEAMLRSLPEEKRNIAIKMIKGMLNTMII